MTTDSGPFAWLLSAGERSCPPSCHDNNTDRQQAAEQISCEISRNVVMALRAPGHYVGRSASYMLNSRPKAATAKASAGRVSKAEQKACAQARPQRIALDSTRLPAANGRRSARVTGIEPALSSWEFEMYLRSTLSVVGSDVAVNGLS